MQEFPLGKESFNWRRRKILLKAKNDQADKWWRRRVRRREGWRLAWAVGSPPPRAILRNIGRLRINSYQMARLGASTCRILRMTPWILHPGCLVHLVLILILPSGHWETTPKTYSISPVSFMPHCTSCYTTSICVLWTKTHMVNNLVATGKALMPPLSPNYQINAVLYQSMFYYHSKVGKSVLYFRFPKSAKNGELANSAIIHRSNCLGNLQNNTPGLGTTPECR